MACAVEMLLACLLFTGVILLSIPDWTSFFSSGFGVHWDTKLMGQWMAWNAQNILDGRFLLPDFNANFFYPHAYALGFSEALWPQSFVYALFYGTTSNPYLSFNGTMLVFWVISGLTMLGLLRELGFNRGISLFGAVVFCLIPYRLGYYIEFNMTLVFTIPLLLMLQIRWLRSLTWGNNLLLVAGFWISATSCIYYTIMSALPMLMIFLIHIRRNPEQRNNPKLWLHVGVASLLALCLVALFLYPYWILRVEGEFARTSEDLAIHFAQATHYLAPHSGEVDYALLGVDVGRIPTRWTEAIIFPGAVLIVLFMTHLVASIVKSNPRSLSAMAGFIEGLLWILFFALIVLAPLLNPADVKPNEPGHPMLVVALPILALIIFAISCSRILIRPSGESESTAFVAATGVAATLCFFISLGPEISVGNGASLRTLGANPIEAILHNVPIFDVLRGLSRFSIIVLFFLILSSMFTLNKLTRRHNWVWFLLPVLCLVLVYDGRQIRYQFEDESWRADSTVLREAEMLSQQQTLVQLPIGYRDLDASATLNTIGPFPLLVNGHSGFEPPGYRERAGLMRKWNIPNLTFEIETIWPSPWLIIDKFALDVLSAGLRKEFPREELDPYWELVADDQYYSLFKPKPRAAVPKGAIKRRVRTDILKKNSFVVFEFQTQAQAISIELNGTEVHRQASSKEWQQVRVELPSNNMGNLEGDEVAIMPVNGLTLTVRNLTFSSKGG